MACSLLNSLDKEENGSFAGAASVTSNLFSHNRLNHLLWGQTKDKERLAPGGILARKCLK